MRIFTVKISFKNYLNYYDSLSCNIKLIGVFGVNKNSNSISNLSQNVILNARAIYKIREIIFVIGVNVSLNDSIGIITLATININSISTNRRPGHCRFPTPNGTTMLAPASEHRLLVFESSMSHRSGM